MKRTISKYENLSLAQACLEMGLRPTKAYGYIGGGRTWISECGDSWVWVFEDGSYIEDTAEWRYDRCHRCEPGAYWCPCCSGVEAKDGFDPENFRREFANGREAEPFCFDRT